MMYDFTLLKYKSEHKSGCLYLNKRQDEITEQCWNLMLMVLSNAQFSTSRGTYHHEQLTF